MSTADKPAKNRMVDAIPKHPAQREAADWWLAELRILVSDATNETEVRRRVVEHARRVSPDVLTSAAHRAGVGPSTTRDERHGRRLLERLADTEVARWRRPA